MEQRYKINCYFCQALDAQGIMLLFYLSILLSVVQPQLSFTRYTAEEGFPQQWISGIAQDYKGRILISSGNNSFSSFDGYDLKNEGNLEGKYNSVSTLFTTSKGRVLGISSKGVICGLEKGGRDLIFEGKDVISILELSENNFCFVSKRQLAFYDGESTRLVDLSLNEVVNCACNCQDHILLGTMPGRLYSYDIKTSECVQLFSFGARINVIFNQGDGLFYIGTRGGGLYLWSESQGIQKHFSEELNSSIVLSLCLDSEGILWVGTLKGLNLIAGGKVIGSYHNLLEDRTSLSHNTIRRIYKDSQGGMWLGTYYGGINYWHPLRRRVINVRPGYSKGTLNDNVPSCIVERSDGTLWIGTNFGGVNSLNPLTGHIVSQYNIPTITEDESRSIDVKAIWHHPDSNRVFIGSFRAGMNVLYLDTGLIQRLPSPENVLSIIPISDKELLVCGNGLYVYNLEAYRYKMIDAKHYEFLFKSKSGQIYSDNYLSKVDPYSNNPVTPTVSQNNIISISESSDTSTLYYATPDSLFSLCVESGKVGSLDLPPSFPKIIGIECDDTALWLSTVFGLYTYSLDSGKITGYYTTDGLTTNFYTSLSHAITSSGKYCFGGVGGVSIIDPVKFLSSHPCPCPIVTDVLVSGKSSSFERSSVKELYHPDNNISLHFSAPDFSAVGTNVFEYKLEGFDRAWIRAGSERTATYSNLPRGNYTFRLRASRKGDDWTCDDKVLMIKVHPAWYLSWPALAFWTSLILLAFMLWMDMTIKRKEKDNKLLMYEMEKKYAKEISKLKILKALNAEIPKGQSPLLEISPTDEQFLSKVLDLVESNIDKTEYSTDALATSLGISRSTLHKKMVSAAGCSALAFILNVRFSKACEMLEQGLYTISEICYKTGFSSPNYFSASFKKRYGCTPRDYLKKRQ